MSDGPTSLTAGSDHDNDIDEELTDCERRATARSRWRMGVVAAAWAMTGVASAQTPRAVPIHYDSALVAGGFPSPVASVIVGDERVLLLIDTGAGVHTIASWLVDAASLQPEHTDRTVTGSTGTQSPVRVIRRLEARAMGTSAPLILTDAVVADFPPLFADHRIGGLISPQLLAGDGERAVLDLGAPSLTFVPAGVPQTGASAGGATAPPSDSSTPARACTHAESPFHNRLYGLSGTVDGVQTDLLIDTGATRTMVAAGSAAGTRLGPRSAASGSATGVGGSIPTRLATGVAIQLGGTITTTDVLLGTGGHDCGPDGLAGMDVLKQCVLSLGVSGGLVQCRAPGR